MKFLVRKDYEGLDFMGNHIIVPRDTYVETYDNFVCFNNLPFCLIDSQVSKDYLIWADDGNEIDRLKYENIILFSDRSKQWDKTVPVFDKEGKIVGYETGKIVSRFTPEEVKFMRTNFSDLLTDDPVILFNNYFYHGSDIKRVSELATYLNSSH